MTFSRIAGPIGKIDTHKGNLGGLIHITGDVEGEISTHSGDLLAGGSITVDGDLIGDIDITGVSDTDVEGDMIGDITVNGDFFGRILVYRHILGNVTIVGDADGELIANYIGTEGGEILGDLTLVDRWNGHLCADNLSPLPANIDIQDTGCASTVCAPPFSLAGAA